MLRQIIILLLAGVSDSSRIWITKVDPITDETLMVQVLVIKDEEVATVVGCKATTRNDVRYSSKRYLMCAGSILTSRYILTSASCIHEATYIRHNIRAPLAVMIAPFSDTAQVIKITGYSIHPGHLVDPRDEHYALHNVAIAKLACKISKRNLHEIKLPTQPFIDQCAEDNCKLIITHEIGPMSFIMEEVVAEDISAVREKRDLLFAFEIKKVNKTANETRLNNHDIKKVVQSNENGNDCARIIKRAEGANNENLKYINQNHSKESHKVFKRSSTFHDNPNRKLVIRKSRGIKGCPQTGSAVMSNIIQSAMVTVSCDDRQPETPWQYTDLFDNLDWISEMIGNWKPSPTLAGCSTCPIYNFFIDYNCKNRAQCQKNVHSGSHPGDAKVPVQLSKCSKNHTDLKTPFVHNHSKIGTPESLNQAYVDAINNLYLNKHEHSDENDDNNNAFSSDSPLDEKSKKNPYRTAVETVKLGLFSQSPNTVPKDFNDAANVTYEKTLVLDYKDNQADRDSNYPKVKATYDNDYKPKGYANGNEHPEIKNYEYQPRYSQIKKPDVVTSTRKSVESFDRPFVDGQEFIPKEFAQLYNKFLEEYRQQRDKINKNVVRRA